MNETVYMASGNRRNRDSRYHTDPDCHRLAVASTVIKVDRRQVNEKYRECGVCAGLAPTSGEYQGHYRSLLQAAGED